MQGQSRTSRCSAAPVGHRVIRTCMYVFVGVLVGNPGKNPSVTLLSGGPSGRVYVGVWHVLVILLF